MRGGCSDAALTVVATPIVIALIWWEPWVGLYVFGLPILLFVLWRVMVEKGLAR